jgi:hypothetical protein
MSRDPQADGLPSSAEPSASVIAVYAERILIGALTALFVARPLTAGDDPGRLCLTSGAGSLVLNSLSFLLLFAWGIRRIWARGPFMTGLAAIVVFGLTAVAALIFTSAAMPDRYQRPGWFIGWDWLSIAVLCFLAWQLASTPAKARAFTAVLMATAACLSAQALYQLGSSHFGWESTEPEKPPAELPLVGDDEFGLNIDQRPAPRAHFRATFDQPETLASFLLLFLPAAVVWGISGWRRGGVESFAMGVPLVIAAGAATALSFLVNRSGYCSLKELLTFIGQAPYWGGGPGNLSRMTDLGTAQACNYWLGLAATTGLPALGVLLLTLFVSLWLNYRQVRSPTTEASMDERKRTPWEFYFGGVAGLLLGMMLATGDIPAESPAAEILRLGVVGGCRSLVWLLAFSLLETVAATGRLRVFATITGVILVAVLGWCCDGLSSPALLQPFWLAVTLAATGSRARNWSPTSLPYAIAGVSLAIFLLAANLLHVTWPGCATASYVRSARQASREYPHWHWKTAGKRGPDGEIATNNAASFLGSTILSPLHDAVKVDPRNSALLLELARWERNHWLYLRNLDEKAAAQHEAHEMLRLAKDASAIDPHSSEPAFSAYTSLLLFASKYPKASDDQLDELDKYINLIASRRPRREVELRFRVVLLLMNRQSQEALQAWSLQLLKLNVEPESPHGRLSEEQRTRLIVGVRNAIKDPSPELAEFLSGVRE